MSGSAPKSVLDLIRGIKDESIDPTELPSEDRQACVAHLAHEGYSVGEIAQILRASERTIFRDRAQSRDANSLARDPALAARFAGQLVAEAEVCVTRIRRAVRDPGTPAATRVDAERACFHILDRVVERLQSLGHLPTAAQQLSADVTHRVELPDLRTLQLEIERLRENQRLYGGGDSALQGELLHLAGVSRLLLAAQGNGDGEPGDDPGA